MPMLTILDVLQKSTAFLQKYGVPDARLSAEWILAHHLGLKRLDLFLQFERPLPEEELAGIRVDIKRRANREPLEHVLGWVEFFGLKLCSDKRAFIPRPETEYLVELIQAEFQEGDPARILDLGTGSGAILLALLSAFGKSSGVGIDLSPEALDLARENGEKTGLADRATFLRSDWFEAVEGTFQIIVANPPYLTAEEMESAEPEVLHYEPELSLFGGSGGLDGLWAILREGSGYLEDGGLLAFETGVGQHDRLKEKAHGAGFSRVESVLDLSRRERYLMLWK